MRVQLNHQEVFLSPPRHYLCDGVAQRQHGCDRQYTLYTGLALQVTWEIKRKNWIDIKAEQMFSHRHKENETFETDTFRVRIVWNNVLFHVCGK